MSYIGKTPTPAPLTSSDITDGIISTSKLADTSVTNAKLNADLISAETELATAPADTDELLISDAGVLKRIDANLIGTPAGWVKIGDTVTCSTNTASVDFDNLSSDYYMYVVIGTMIRPETTASRLTMNFGTDGSTYASAKTSIYSEEYANEGGTDHGGIAINTTYSLDFDTGDQNISSGLSNHGNYGKAGTMIAWLTGLGQGGNYASYMVNVNGWSNDNYAKWARANGQIQASADCVRFKFHQHGIADGKFTLFGVTQ